jgi:hypothetical protein
MSDLMIAGLLIVLGMVAIYGIGRFSKPPAREVYHFDGMTVEEKRKSWR